MGTLPLRAHELPAILLTPTAGLGRLANSTTAMPTRRVTSRDVDGRPGAIPSAPAPSS